MIDHNSRAIAMLFANYIRYAFEFSWLPTVEELGSDTKVKVASTLTWESLKSPMRSRGLWWDSPVVDEAIVTEIMVSIPILS